MRATVSPVISRDSDSLPLKEARIRFRWIVAISVCFTIATCYLRDFVLPNVAIISWGDQTLFATDGARIVAGQMPYRDYFQLVTPGTDLVYAFLFRHFGLRLWIPDMVMVCLAATGVLLLTLAAGKVLRGAFVALPAALTVGFVLFGGMDATHHWFSAVVVMAAMLVLLNGSSGWHIAIAGLLCGVAASFTQSRGAAVTVGFLIYLVWQSLQHNEKAGIAWRRCLLLCGAALVSFVAINGWYIKVLGASEWIKWVVVFPFKYYPTMPNHTWRALFSDFSNQTGVGRWVCLPFLFVALPLAYGAFLWVMYRRRRSEPSEPWDKLLLLAITGLAMSLSVVSCPSVMRVSSASLPGMILLAWLLNRWGKPGKTVAGVLAALSLAIAVYLPGRNQTMRWHYLDLPAGRTAILDPNRYELYRWMAENTHPGQMYFGITPIPFPLWLQTPAPISSPVPYAYDRPEHIAASIDAIEKNRIPLLLLRPYTYLAGTWGYKPEPLQPFQDYVVQHYRRIKTFPTGDEAWRRTDSPQPDSTRNILEK
jgi:hypothetical protein